MTSFRLGLAGLLHQKGRTAISVTGAAFAVLLIFMQLGFLGAVENTATLLYDKFEFDILITSSEYIDASRPGVIRRSRLAQARAAAPVQDVLPMTLGNANWRNPTDHPVRGGRLWPIVILGVEPNSLERTFRASDTDLFENAADRDAKSMAIRRLETVLMDRRSRPDFGDPIDMPTGTRTEVNDKQIELAGYFSMGTGFSYTGLLIANEQTLAEMTRRPMNDVTFGLVQLKPGSDVNAARDEIAAILPPDCQVFTRAQIGAQEREYWVKRTAVGQFFYFGVLLAITVGGIFIYQMMVADIKKHLPEYATLKSMGYRFGFLFRIVLAQAVFLAVGGYTLGALASFGFYEITRNAAHMPINMTNERLVIVLALTVFMCVGSGLLAVRKVKSADPADLF